MLLLSRQSLLTGRFLLRLGARNVRAAVLLSTLHGVLWSRLGVLHLRWRLHRVYGL
ncbi:hypothetical protein CS8_055160 [Cupriavidus sp. 8B]